MLRTIKGNIFLKQGEIDKAIQMFQASIRLNPAYADNYNNLGVAFLKKRYFTEAIKQFKETLKRSKDHRKARENLNHSVKVLHQLNSRIRSIQFDLDNSPATSNLRNELGKLYIRKGEYQKAFNQFGKVLSIDPDNMDSHVNIANLFAAQKDYTNAINFYKKVLKLEPNRPEIIYNIACMYAKKNEQKKSVAWLQKALQKGYHNWDLIKNDHDLDNIRNTSDFKKILKSIQN